MKTTIRLVFAIFCLSAAAGNSQAVSPPPYGGYPGGNTAEGLNALLSLTTGSYNTALGYLSLTSDSIVSFNTGVGAGTLLVNTAANNTATGAGALLSNTTGESNTANGAFALFFNVEGNFNTANGYQALLNNTGTDNTADGAAALQNNAGGSFNTATGRYALINNFTGNFNIAVGNFAGEGITSANNVIAIGTGGQNVSNSCYVGNIWNQPGGSQAVYVNSNGKLGAQVSSRHFKDEIKPMAHASGVIYSLKPVSFRYKPEVEPARPLGFGLIAEDVEKISPDLVVRGRDGEVISVRYDAVNAMLLNEFLKEHKAFVEQQRTVEELKKQVAVLTIGLQKVSGQLELTNRDRQTALNDR